MSCFDKKSIKYTEAAKKLAEEMEITAIIITVDVEAVNKAIEGKHIDLEEPYLTMEVPDYLPNNILKVLLNSAIKAIDKEAD